MVLRCWVTRNALRSVIMDLLKAAPSFWRAKLVEGLRVDPIFITSQEVGKVP